MIENHKKITLKPVYLEIIEELIYKLEKEANSIFSTLSDFNFYIFPINKN